MAFDPIAKARSRLWAVSKYGYKHVPFWALFIGTVSFSGFSPSGNGFRFFRSGISVIRFLSSPLFYFSGFSIF
jgi:hypothetical protein